MKISLYQIIPELDYQKLMFQPLYYVKSLSNQRVPAELYECVFSGELEADTLDDIFRIFNIEFPEGYKSRSMSVSDVVEIQTGQKRAGFYYCNPVGFEKIEFEKNKTMLSVQNHNFDAVMEIRENVSAFFIGNNGLVQVLCSKMILQRCKYSQSQLGYEIRCKIVDNTEATFTFQERPSVIVSPCKDEFPENLLYEPDKNGNLQMRFPAHSKENLGIVITWLMQKNYPFESIE